jgi:hypothetical protein
MFESVLIPLGRYRRWSAVHPAMPLGGLSLFNNPRPETHRPNPSAAHWCG